MKENALVSLYRAMRSRRTAAVALLSFSSGLPLGLVWFAVPDWMRDIGVDIRLVGLFSLAQAPWAFKVIWSPLMDRYVPPFWGRRRGWMAITQIALCLFGLVLAGVGQRPEAIWVVGAIALAIGLASASQDIAYDAYTVEILHKDEQGVAVGARTAMYRAAMAVAGGASITMAARVGWPLVNVVLALMYIPILLITWRSPEPDSTAPPPRTLREAVWLPLVEVLSRPRAIEILAFVVLYKLADQLSQALTRPFLIDMGYTAEHRGIALATVGLFGTIAGAMVGGWLTTLIGLGRSLWIFGFLQVFSNIGYWLLAIVGRPSLPLMYGATSFELFTSGLGTGAFSVLLLRMTEKRFSATQYALFSSLFALPRVLAGPIAGMSVHAIGWATFYLATMIAGAPGLIMLARFVPIGVRDPDLSAVNASMQAPVLLSSDTGHGWVVRGAAWTFAAAVGASAVLAFASVLDAAGRNAADPPGFFQTWAAVWQPHDMNGWLQIVSIVAVSVVFGLAAVAIGAIRSNRVDQVRLTSLRQGYGGPPKSQRRRKPDTTPARREDARKAPRSG
jgi:PAT family beta-lactamase induction signal transducer AmpG